MNQRTREHRCTSCGAEIEVPPDGKLRTTIAGASGKPNMHVLSVDGREIHRCEAQTQIAQSDDAGEPAEAQLS